MIKFDYGSHVYGTNTKYSDRDYIVVYDNKDFIPVEDPNYHVFSFADFCCRVSEHKPDVLECISLLMLNKRKNFLVSEEYEYMKDLLLDYYAGCFSLKRLRSSFSQVASNSWVKAKKKILLSSEDSYIGIKSLFHSIRLLDFGIQIAKNKCIQDFSSCNELWEVIFHNRVKLMSCKYEEDYKECVAPYKLIYNEKHTEFKKVTEK